MTMETLSPILLASDPFALEGDGASFHVKPQQLMNPNREPMLIDEVRLSLSAVDSVLAARELGMILANLTLGNAQLTNGLCPVISFAPVYSQPAFRLKASVNTLVWHFAKPLYVPTVTQFGATFQRRNPFPNTWDSTPGTQFFFTLAGRSIPAGMPVPSRIYVPYACSTSVYRSTFNPATGETTPFTSKDNEIGNPFDADLRMSYFAGYNLAETDSLNPTGNPTLVPILVQATYASGKMLIRDQTPFGALFPIVHSMFRTNGLMKPKDFIKFTLSMNPIVGAANAQNDIKFTTIGMTSYRLMQTPLGGFTP